MKNLVDFIIAGKGNYKSNSGEIKKCINDSGTFYIPKNDLANNLDLPTARISVFVTKNMKFRAKIKESNTSIPYEVTIGGKSWNDGKGREFEDVIIKKCNTIIRVLNKNLNAYENLS